MRFFIIIIFSLHLGSGIHELLWSSQHLNIVISSLTVLGLQITTGATFLFLISYLISCFSEAMRMKTHLLK